jgi:hypothetical protein
VSGIERRYCPDCEREHMFAIGGHKYEPGPFGRCTYCGGREQYHITRVTKVDAASDGHPVLQADGGSSGVASTAVARASTPSQQDGAAAIGRS